MKRTFLAVFLLIMSFGVFKALEQPAVYHCTLGVIAPGYMQKGGHITEVSQPFTAPNETNYYRWDVKFYKQIRDHSYHNQQTVDESWYPGDSRIYAFFPFFPWVWKLSGLSSAGIGILNYAFFVISLLILQSLFMKKSEGRMLFFLAALLLPVTVVYHMPYTEALFMLCFSLAVYGLMRNRYWLVFIGLFCWGATRPAMGVALIAFFSLDIYAWMKHRSFKKLTGDLLRKVVPASMGTLLVAVLQYAYTGEWFIFVHAQRHWDHYLQWPSKLNDWSAEGFGLSVFVLFMISIPLLAMVLKKGWKGTLVDHTDERSYYVALSAIYIIGVTLFILLFQGGNLHGLHRYAMASPFFYILWFNYADEYGAFFRYPRFRWLMVLLGGAVVLMTFNSYGRGWNFKDLGFMLLVLWMGGLYAYPRVRSVLYRYTGLSVLVLLSILWQVYMFNIYLSGGWLFT